METKDHTCYDCGRPSGADHPDASCDPCARRLYAAECARGRTDTESAGDDWTDGGRRGDAGGL